MRNKDLMPKTVAETQGLSAEYQPIHQKLENGELIIFDPLRQKSHLLNPAAAMIYNQCDGRSAQSKVAELLGKNGKRRLLFGLQTLNEAGLVLAVAGDIKDFSITRRSLLARLSKAAALIPAITTLSIPAPAGAQSGCLNGCLLYTSPSPRD